MDLSKKEREFLTTFVAIADKFLKSPSKKGKLRNGIRYRRSSADAAQLRKKIVTARKRKVPVRKIADKFGITPAYVYQIVKPPN